MDPSDLASIILSLSIILYLSCKAAGSQHDGICNRSISPGLCFPSISVPNCYSGNWPMLYFSWWRSVYSFANCPDFPVDQVPFVHFTLQGGFQIHRSRPVWNRIYCWAQGIRRSNAGRMSHLSSVLNAIVWVLVDYPGKEAAWTCFLWVLEMWR
jgi:hypothetical protein